MLRLLDQKIRKILLDFYEPFYAPYVSATTSPWSTFVIYLLLAYITNFILMATAGAILYLIFPSFGVREFLAGLLCPPLYISSAIYYAIANPEEEWVNFFKLDVLLQLSWIFLGIMWIGVFVYVCSLMPEAERRRIEHYSRAMFNLFQQKGPIAIAVIMKRLRINKTVAEWWVEEITKQDSISRVDEQHIEVNQAHPIQWMDIPALMTQLNDAQKRFRKMADALRPQFD
ncbi:MAG: hypothetical protein ACXACI_02860 [Candidatus Hodarchaeales archaeon]|jgi:hypothetical protein